MDKTFKWHLFVTSFIPLWISITLIDIWNIATWLINNINTELSFVCNLKRFLASNYLLLMTLVIINIVTWISIFKLNKFLLNKNTEESKPIAKIIRAQHGRNLIADFILSFILPMIAFDFTDLLGLLLFLIYFSTLAIVCIRNNNVYINIYFELRGYKMYSCSIECTRANNKVVFEDSIVISKSDLTAKINQTLNYWDFDNKIYVDITDE